MSIRVSTLNFPSYGQRPYNDKRNQGHYLYTDEKINKYICLICTSHQKLSKEDGAAHILANLKYAEPLSWKDALDQAGDGDQTLLLSMLKHGLLLKLSQESKSEIFDFALVEEEKYIIHGLLKIGLTQEEREDALKYALEVNDFELVKAAIEGGPGQETLDFRNWSGEQPLAAIESLQNRGGGIDPSIISLLCSCSSLKLKDLQEAEWRQFLSNIWNVEHGEFFINGEKIEYAGAFISFFIDKILEALSKTQSYEWLSNLIAGSKIDIDAKTRLTIYRQNRPILIHGGCIDHAVDVILFESYLIVGNQGLFSEMPVKIYKINPQKVSVELIQKISQSIDKESHQEAADFFNFQLPNYLQGKESPSLNRLLIENWIGPLFQQGSNCVWASLKAALSGMTVLFLCSKNEQAQEKMLKEQVVSEAFKIIEELCNFISLWGIEQYLNCSSEEPARMDKYLINQILQKAKERFGQPNHIWNARFQVVANRCREFQGIEPFVEQWQVLHLRGFLKEKLWSHQ